MRGGVEHGYRADCSKVLTSDPINRERIRISSSRTEQLVGGTLWSSCSSLMILLWS